MKKLIIKKLNLKKLIIIQKFVDYQSAYEKYNYDYLLAFKVLILKY